MNKALLLVAILGLAPAAVAEDSRESVAQLVIEDATSVLGSSATETTDEFFLGRSEYFSAEVLVSSGTPNYDLILQFKKLDGTWVDDPDGDVATGATAAWDLHTLSPDYFTRALRLKITNDDGSAATFTVVLHRDSPRRLK